MQNSSLNSLYKNDFDATLYEYQSFISDSRHFVFIYRFDMYGKNFLYENDILNNNTYTRLNNIEVKLRFSFFFYKIL